METMEAVLDKRKKKDSPVSILEFALILFYESHLTRNSLLWESNIIFTDSEMISDCIILHLLHLKHFELCECHNYLKQELAIIRQIK